MHFVVLIRYIYFFVCFTFNVSLAVVAGTAIHAHVPLVGSTPALFLAIPGSLALVVLLGFDIYRTRTGDGYFCFVYKIWFELSWTGLLMVVHMISFFATYDQDSRHPCVSPTSAVNDTHIKPCTALKLMWAFQIMVFITTFLYLGFLSIVTILHHTENSNVFSGSVRGVPWGIRNCASRSRFPDPRAPINFPTSNIPSFNESFANSLEEGKGEHRYPPQAPAAAYAGARI